MSPKFLAKLSAKESRKQIPKENHGGAKENIEEHFVPEEPLRKRDKFSKG
jgi:hypothetical protein